MRCRTVPPDDLGPRPIYTVWEPTLRCDHACSHCGSRAGAARSDELSTAELLEVAASVVKLGTREVTIIGGEAYLRPDVYEIVAYLHAHDVRVTMQTGDLAFTPERARRFKDAGLDAIGVSIACACGARRERLVAVERPAGDPYDFGRFELVEEAWAAE